MSEKYTEGSRISQGFVGCNRNAAVERSSVANGLESTKAKNGQLQAIAGCGVLRLSDRLLVL
jgi:hypothetical protein